VARLCQVPRNAAVKWSDRDDSNSDRMSKLCTALATCIWVLQCYNKWNGHVSEVKWSEVKRQPVRLVCSCETTTAEELDLETDYLTVGPVVAVLAGQSPVSPVTTANTTQQQSDKHTILTAVKKMTQTYLINTAAQVAWLPTHRRSPIQVLTGPDVEQLRW